MSQTGRGNSSDDSGKLIDETAPLLATTTSALFVEPVEPTAHVVESGVVTDDDTPLPRLQIFLLSYTRLVEPIAFFSIFPYINFMIEKTGGIDKKDVGFYSGLIESLFSATQMCVMLFWGRVASNCLHRDLSMLTQHRLLTDSEESRF
jgi:hypothetical protein